MQTADGASETWALRLVFGTVVTLFFTWLVGRIREVEKGREEDQRKGAETANRVTAVETGLKQINESERASAASMSKIAESSTRIESALLGFGGKGGLIDAVQKLADDVQQVKEDMQKEKR